MNNENSKFQILTRRGLEILRNQHKSLHMLNDGDAATGAEVDCITNMILVFKMNPGPDDFFLMIIDDQLGGRRDDQNDLSFYIYK